jgi:hypothetical protein
MNLESNYTSGLNEEASAACIAHETETTEHDVKYVILGADAKVSQLVQCI